MSAPRTLTRTWVHPQGATPQTQRSDVMLNSDTLMVQAFNDVIDIFDQQDSTSLTQEVRATLTLAVVSMYVGNLQTQAIQNLTDDLCAMLKRQGGKD